MTNLDILLGSPGLHRNGAEGRIIEIECREAESNSSIARCHFAE